MGARNVSNLKQTFIITKYEFLKCLKSKRLPVTIALLTPLAILTLFLVEWGGADTLVEFVDEYFLYISLGIAILGVIYGSDVISSEFEQKTGYVTLTAPIGRGWMLIGKFIAGFASVFIAVVILYVVGCVYMLHTYGTLPGGLIGSILLTLLFGAATLGLAFLFSTVIPGDLLPVLACFFFFVIIMPYVEAFLIGLHIDPWFLLTYARKDIPLVSMDPAPRRVIPNPEGPLYTYPELPVGIVVMLAYLAITLLLSIYVFKRRQMR